jgi:sialic acid synthase SpsE
MVDDAKRLGVFGVKIQKRCPEAIPDAQKDAPRRGSNSFGDTYYEHRRALEFNVEQVCELKRYVEQAGLVFVVSVFDMVSLKTMVEIAGVKYVKLPSQLLTHEAMNLYLLLRCKTCGLTIMHSTGMHTLEELKSFRYLNHFDVTYYCRSMYPYTREQADLGVARLLFDMMINVESRGYSSHDKNGELVPWFVLLGARWVERHYTLDKGMKGTDHGTVSSDFAEMQRIIGEVEDIEKLTRPQNVSELVNAQEVANRNFYMREVKT